MTCIARIIMPAHIPLSGSMSNMETIIIIHHKHYNSKSFIIRYNVIYGFVLLLTFLSCDIGGRSLVDGAKEITFPFGRVQGQDEIAEDTRKPYSAYYGIPFAAPPVGGLRFRPTQSYVSNDPNKVISSPRFRPSCMQVQVPGQTLRMSEDCLHLNVFVPPDSPTQPLKKVMVYIHGGAYVIGDAREGRSSRIVTDYDVIVVTIQYRLGVLGFLSTADDVQPGNNGYLDQLMALKWVKSNIRQFGGDETDITIFGESAGAGSVSALSISPLSKGLFTKGIMQSGTTLSPWAITRDPAALTYKLAQNTGCLPSFYIPGFRSSYHEQIMACLRKKPVDVINAPPTFSDVEGGKTPEVDLDLSHYIEFGPAVDGIVLPKDPSILLQDTDYLRDVGALDRDYVIGVTNNEGLVMLDSMIYAVPGATVKNYIEPRNVRDLLRSSTESVLPVTVKASAEVLNAVSYVYTYPRSPNGDIPLQKTLDITTDTNFVVPSVLFARRILQASPSVNIFMYLFDHFPRLKDPKFPSGGSTHGLDLAYLFDRSPQWDYVTYYGQYNTADDAPLFGVFRGALTSFAKTGVPFARSPTPWPRYERDTEYYMSISLTPTVEQQIFGRRVALWTEFLPKLIQNSLRVFSRGPDFVL